MELSRRSFVKLAMMAPLAVKFHRGSPNGLRTLRGNVGLYSEEGGTIGWYKTADTFVVVDSQFPDSAAHFMKAIQPTRKIDVLINTHHHGDHTAGNWFLKSETLSIVAQKNVPEFQRRNAVGTERENRQAYADTTFEKEWTTEMGVERIRARHFGPGHTAGDAVIHFEQANVAHLGDLVFNNIYPYIDVKKGGATIPGWIQVLEKVAAEYPSDVLYIFGHSASDEDVTGGRSEALRMRDYLTALADLVRKEKKSGKTLDQIHAAYKAIPKFEWVKEGWEGAFRHNLESAYSSLE